MKIIGDNPLLNKILNKQFTIIGEKCTFKDIPETGMIEKDGKKWKWYEYYKFTEEQEKEWREWSYKQLEHLGEENSKKIMDFAELIYGFVIRYTKKGQLF